MLKQYPAIVHKEKKSDYGVSFPDLPGCVTAGSTPDEAYDFAREALQLHIDGLLQDAAAVPDPSPLSEVVGQVRKLGALVAFMVPVQLPGRAKRVDLTLDENLLVDIDHAAAGRGMSRSGFLAEGARHLLRGCGNSRVVEAAASVPPNARNARRSPATASRGR